MNFDQPTNIRFSCPSALAFSCSQVDARCTWRFVRHYFDYIGGLSKDFSLFSISSSLIYNLFESIEFSTFIPIYERIG